MGSRNHTVVRHKMSSIFLYGKFWTISSPFCFADCTFWFGIWLVNDRVPTYLHNRPALNHFWAIRPDSHLTISIFAWYLPLKDWNLYYVFAHLFAIWPFLSLFDPTRTRPFAICIDLYSTNLVSVHSLLLMQQKFDEVYNNWIRYVPNSN